MEILIKNGKMEWKGSIRKTYDQYLHPINLDYKNEDMWKLVGTGTVPDLFQFSTQVGIQTAKLVKPKNLVELAHANSLMRLMGDGTITPTEKYLQFRENPQLWYKEMADYHLTKEEVAIMESYLKPYFGVSATQEDLMLMSMDSGISGFDLVLANKLRKSIAKKKAELVKEIKDILFTMGQEKGNSINVLNYFWDKHIVPQLGYALMKGHIKPCELC